MRLCQTSQDYLPLVQNDPRFNLTSNLVRWLESLRFTQERLKAQTFTSFRHSSVAIELSKTLDPQRFPKIGFKVNFSATRSS